jgi:VIT1/CCC1 family predicted Fe2+/Mn2+ transporter
MLLRAQANEVTEYEIYTRLAKRAKGQHNKDVLLRIAKDEKDHAEYWEQYTGQQMQPSRLKVFWYLLVARFLGLTFSIRLMEKGEEQAQVDYSIIAESIPEAKRIEEEENAHEQMLIGMLEEKKLAYAGSVVLGLNDALVELTGALAGLTLALRDARLIAVVGLITGIAAAFSMAASEYLSTKTENTGQSPFKAAIYTGIAYLFTVIFLIMPFLLSESVYMAMGLTIAIALLIIFAFNFYIAVVQDLNFWRRFGEMTAISMGVAVLAFGIGWAVRLFFDLEV